MARPTRLTAEVEKRICDALAAGNTRADAARYAGINPSTFYDWMKRGRSASRGRFSEFANKVREAEARCAVGYVATVKKAAAKDWRAAAWWLSRRRKAFRDKQQAEVKGAGPGGEIPVTIYLPSKGDGDDQATAGPGTVSP
jgi:hypothetical protein